MPETALADLTEYNPGPKAGPDGQSLPSERSLDPERSWVKVTCPSGHEFTVQAHEGGSRAFCPTDGTAVDYGGYVHQPVEAAMLAARVAEARALLQEVGELPTPDREVVHGDTATGADQTV